MGRKKSQIVADISEEFKFEFVDPYYLLAFDGLPLDGKFLTMSSFDEICCQYYSADDNEFHHIGASAARDGHSCFLRMCMIHKVMY